MGDIIEMNGTGEISEANHNQVSANAVMKRVTKHYSVVCIQTHNQYLPQADQHGAGK